MLKRHNRFFLSLLVLHDVVAVVVAFAVSFAIRFSFPAWFPFDDKASEAATQQFFLICVVSWPLCAQLSGLYRSRRTASFGDEWWRVFRSSVASLLVVVSFAYFVYGQRYSRGVILLFGALSFVFVGVGRYVFRRMLRVVRSRGFNLRYVLVVGGGALGEKVVRTIHEHIELGLRVIGVISDQHERMELLEGAPVLGKISEVQRVLREYPSDQVIIALPIDQLGGLKALMDQLSLETVDVRIVPDLYQFATLGRGVEEFGGLPMIALQDSPLYGWNSVAKRLFDLVVSITVLVMFSPLYLLLAILVKATSKGPVFYKQERMGLDGRTFHMLKFRSMRVDAESSGARMATADDPRRTAMGVFLRRSSLDELPQFWNVLVGDMSVVGPRPERPAFIEDFKQHIPKYHLRHKMKAGITGWAQVNGLRGKTSIPTRIEYDLYYIEHWSFMLDVKIVLRTMLGGFLKNAY